MAAVAAQPSRGASRLAWVLWVLAVALAISGGVLVTLNGHPIVGNVTIATIYVSMGFTGALIASRQSENPIGWVLIGSTVVIGLAFATNEYSVYATEGRGIAAARLDLGRMGGNLGMGGRDSGRSSPCCSCSSPTAARPRRDGVRSSKRPWP